jgi:hypothetical protein
MVTALMEDGELGNFLIRDKQDEPHCYALAVVTGVGKLVTFLITRRLVPHFQTPLPQTTCTSALPISMLFQLRRSRSSGRFYFP